MPGRAKGPATNQLTRSRGCGQDPVRKGDKGHRLSRWCEIGTRVSPGAKFAHLMESAAGGWLPRSGCVSRCKAPRAFKEKAAALLILGDTNEYLYWNFTTNARRGSLLHALDARVKGSGDVF